jgi:hypothetical protein
MDAVGFWVARGALGRCDAVARAKPNWRDGEVALRLSMSEITAASRAAIRNDRNVDSSRRLRANCGHSPNGAANGSSRP